MRTVALVLSVLAALRLGWIGFFGFDLVGSLFGSSLGAMSWVDRIICSIVGIAGIYGAFALTEIGDNEAVER